MRKDTEVERPLASLSAIVDEGYRAVFGLTELYVEHAMTVGRPRCVEWESGVCVMQLVMRPNTKQSRTVTVGEVADERESGHEGRRDGFQVAGARNPLSDPNVCWNGKGRKYDEGRRFGG